MIFIVRSNHLQTATTATGLLAGAVSRDGGDVLDAADLHTRTGKRTQRGLGSGSRALGPGTTGGAELDVQRRDTELLAASGHVLRRQHRRVGAALVTVSLHLHSSGDPHEGLA